MNNKSSKIASAVAATLMLFSVVVFNACTKEKKSTPADPCLNVACANGGTCSGGSCVCPTGFTGTHCETQTVTSLVYTNMTYTPISITINGVTKTIAVGGTTTFTGTNGSSAVGTASTSVRTTGGALIGLEMTWAISRTFPSNTQSVELNVPSTYFFIQMKNNNSTHSIANFYVNYNLTGEQVYENVSIPNDGQTYNVGYFKAFTNSNVRAYPTTGTPWIWQSLNLPFTQNQGILLTAN